MDNSTQKLLKGASLYFIGNALTQLISLALLRFVTGHITPEEYGIYNFIITLSNLITPLVTLQISDAVFKFLLKAKSSDEKKAYLTLTFLISIASSVLILLGVFITNAFIVDVPHALLVALYMIANNLCILYQRIARSLEKNAIYVKGNLIKTTLFIVLKILFISLLDMGVEALFLATFLSDVFFLIFSEFFIRALKFFDIKSVQATAFKAMLKYSIPLIPNTAFWWLTSSVNTLIVTTRLGLDVNGIYTVANKFSSVLIMVTSVFNMAWQESAIKEYGTKAFKEFFTKTFSMYTKLIFSAIAVLIPFVFLVFPYLIDTTYHSSIPYAPFLLIVSGISTLSGFFAQIFAGEGKTYKSLWTSALGMLFNVAVVFLLVDKIGLWAAVFGSMAADGVMLLSRMFLVRKEFTRSVEIFKILCTGGILAISVVLYLNATFVYNAIWFVLAATFAVLLNLRFIKDIVSLLLGRFKRKKPEEL